MLPVSLIFLVTLPSKYVVILLVKLNVVFVQVCKQFIGAEHASDLDQLVIIVVAMEERLLAEDLSKEENQGVLS